MLKALATIYVIGFFVVGLFLTFSADMTASESMDIAAEWPYRLYKYVDLYFTIKEYEEMRSQGH